jgi:23S rRNA (cytidine1920-2'-O)/16S rRNA (cytidine1409-2'-O)-methyltransferase
MTASARTQRPQRTERVDKLLVDRGLVESRERAQRLIMAGLVFAGTARIEKPGARVTRDAPLEVRGEEHPYVSRGGMKLAAVLDALALDVRGMVALDVGASTGGFTDCLLQRGARRVYAVDVGYGQLAWKLREDARVVSLERTNVRHLLPERIPEPLDLATIDASFISLRLVLPAVQRLLSPGRMIVALVKPQFEVGRGKVGKGGVVRDPVLHAAVLDDLEAFARAAGLVVRARHPSPLLGPAGNREFFLVLTTTAAPPDVSGDA